MEKDLPFAFRRETHLPAPIHTKSKPSDSGFDLEKEEGAFGYGVFAALTQTAETEWKRLLLTWRKAVANHVLAWNLAAKPRAWPR